MLGAVAAVHSNTQVSVTCSYERHCVQCSDSNVAVDLQNAKVQHAIMAMLQHHVCWQRAWVVQTGAEVVPHMQDSCLMVQGLQSGRKAYG